MQASSPPDSHPGTPPSSPPIRGSSHRARISALSASLLLTLGGATSPGQPPEPTDHPDPEKAAPNSPAQGRPSLLVGVGRHDITGPALDCGFMGYANPRQRGRGIHMRLWARAFVISSSDQAKRVAIVNADLGMIFQAVKQQVVSKLQQHLGGLYDHRNVLLTATHTHSGPGGYSHYFLYNTVSGGFDPQNFAVVVDGIVAAILQAHHSQRPGAIKIAKGELIAASENRSRQAYLENSPAERARYRHDVDRSMTLLRFEDAAGRAIGMLNWFAVHPTNVGNENTLISGDNKGYASFAFERLARKEGGQFVAAFAQSSLGDVSPNLWGTPDGVHDFERMEIIAKRQLAIALELQTAAKTELAPILDHRHTYVKFAGLKVAGRWVGDGKPQVLGRAAIGASKLAGAEDARGLPLFREGLVYGDNWPALSLTPRDQAQHFEKPIVLITGTARRPLTPDILPLQVITIGKLAIIAAPFEINTMVGRRLQEDVLKVLASRGVTQAVIAGLSNAYSGYVATREEYAVQHYEGASTHFGPFTSAALRQEYDRLAQALASGAPVAPGPAPRVLNKNGPSRQPGPDALPPGISFGEVLVDAAATVRTGQRVRASFWSGHPRHHLQTMDTYLRVQRFVSGAWQTIATDADPSTRIRWRRARRSLVAEIEWHPQDADFSTPGSYRLLHHGHFKDGTGIHRFEGTSRSFELSP